MVNMVSSFNKFSLENHRHGGFFDSQTVVQANRCWNWRGPLGQSPFKIKIPTLWGLNGGIEGARTLDLLRDRQTL